MIDYTNVEILDTTLREGEQCYGVFFPIEVKKRIALLLDEIGVDFIEVGHPAAAPSIREAVSAIIQLGLRSRLVAHARLEQREIGLVRDLGLQWIGLFCGVSDRCQKRYGLSKRELFKKVDSTISFARELGLSVKFSCEDASRTEVNDLLEFYSFLAGCGVDRLSYADTLGALRPPDIEKLNVSIGERVPFSRLHFHFHNDFGFAYRNAVEAIEHGCRCIDVSVLGIGERMGIVPLESLLAYLGKTGERRHEAATVRKLAELVETCIDHERFRNRRFAHKSGIHLNGIIKDSANYELVDPDKDGNTRLFVLSKMIGRTGLQMLLTRNGLTIDEGNLLPLLERIKADESLELAEPEEIRKYLLDVNF